MSSDLSAIRTLPSRRQAAYSWIWIACAVAAIALVAFVLRVYAVGWGLPYTDHPDEPSAANKVLNMIRRGDWNPRFFEKPSLYYYLLRLDFAAHLRYGFATGLYKSMADLPRTTDLYLTTPQLFVWGRMLSVALGTATVVALYMVGRRWWSARVGLVAAALLAVSSFHMRESQYITVDVATTLVTLLALAAALRLLDRPGWGAYALAGFAAGLAASAKYNAGAVVVSIAAAHVAVWGRASLRKSGRLAWAALFSLLGFVAASPYAVLSFDSFLYGIQRQYGTYAPRGHGSHTWPVLEYLSFFWEDGLHPLPFLAALAGIVLVIARRDRRGLVMLAFIPTQLLFFLAQDRHFSRNLLPIIPPLLLFAALGIVAAADGLARLLDSRRGRPRWAGWVSESLVTVVLATLVVAEPLADAVALTRFEALPHSKVRAGGYLSDRLPHGAPIAAALNPAQLAGQPFAIPIDDVAEHDAGWYRAQGYRFLIANTKEADPQRYQTLRTAAQVLEIFPGDKEGQPGPRMEALDLGMHPDDLAIEGRPAVFGGKLRLLGFQRGAGDLRPAFTPLPGGQDVRRGQGLLLNLYWQALERVDADYAIFLHLVDSQGRTVAQRDTVMRAADYPTSRWQPGELAVDLADLPIPTGLARGQYRLEMGVYRMDTSAGLRLEGGDGGALALMTVQVT